MISWKSTSVSVFILAFVSVINSRADFGQSVFSCQWSKNVVQENLRTPTKKPCYCCAFNCVFNLNLHVELASPNSILFGINQLLTVVHRKHEIHRA
jgi:hypothetical protein